MRISILSISMTLFLYFDLSVGHQTKILFIAIEWPKCNTLELAKTLATDSFRFQYHTIMK